MSANECKQIGFEEGSVSLTACPGSPLPRSLPGWCRARRHTLIGPSLGVTESGGSASAGPPRELKTTALSGRRALFCGMACGAVGGGSRGAIPSGGPTGGSAR